MKKAISVILAILLVSMGLLTACGNSAGQLPSGTPSDAVGSAAPEGAGSGDVIKIGLNEPSTGALAGFGSFETEGVEFAHKHRPTVLGRPVELVKSDNKSDKVEAATVATKLIDQDKVVAMIGCSGSNLTMSAGEVAKAKEILLLSPTATNPLVTQGNPWCFRMCFIDTYQGQVMAKYAYDQGYRKIGVLREVNNDFCIGLARYFTDTFVGFSGDESSIITADFQNGDQDFSSQITTMMQGEPDAIFIPCPSNFGDVAMIAKQLHQLGHTIPILGSDGYEAPELLELGGQDVDNIYYSSFFDTSATLTPATEEFIKLYQEENGRDPAANVVLAYDAYNILLDAIEAAGSTDSAAIREALKSVDNWEGAGGYVTFDENNNPNKAAVIKVIQDGEFKYVSTVTLDD